MEDMERNIEEIFSEFSNDCITLYGTALGLGITYSSLINIFRNIADNRLLGERLSSPQGKEEFDKYSMGGQNGDNFLQADRFRSYMLEFVDPNVLQAMMPNIKRHVINAY